jgi:hypothetical protein
LALAARFLIFALPLGGKDGFRKVFELNNVRLVDVSVNHGFEIGVDSFPLSI